MFFGDAYLLIHSSSIWLQNKTHKSWITCIRGEWRPMQCKRIDFRIFHGHRQFPVVVAGHKGSQYWSSKLLSWSSSWRSVSRTGIEVTLKGLPLLVPHSMATEWNKTASHFSSRASFHRSARRRWYNETHQPRPCRLYSMIQSPLLTYAEILEKRCKQRMLDLRQKTDTGIVFASHGWPCCRKSTTLGGRDY